ECAEMGGRRGTRHPTSISRLLSLACDATMYHMKKASIRDLRYDFPRIERLLREGEEIEITKRRRTIGRLVPERNDSPRMPDFLARLQDIYGDRVLKTSGAEIAAGVRARD